MSHWLDPLRAALDGRSTPLAVFCRDDDAGWDDAALARLLGVCGDLAQPIDLAVIPAALTEARAAWLRDQRHVYPARLGLHQHGWSHRNHEPDGRPCEFGRSRPLDRLIADVARGRAVLTSAFGRAVDPIFTPPWNRCVSALAPHLVTCGLVLLSREATATPWHAAGLTECSPHADWASRTRGVAAGRDAFVRRVAARASAAPTLGLLFHHATMDGHDLVLARELLTLLGTHGAARAVALREAAALEVRGSSSAVDDGTEATA